MKKISVLLAEDHETVRQGLRLLIEGQPDMVVVGEAGDGQAAVASVAALRPQVAVLDIGMPKRNGLEAAREIRAASPSTAVVALTRHSDDAYVKELLDAGAAAYVLKQSPSAELLDAVRAAAAGRRYLDRSLADRTQKRLEAHTSTARPRITDREASVLRLMALGFSNKDIANDLSLSVKTVEVHKANAMRKLGLAGRTDVIRYALLQGWLRDP